MDSDLPRGQKVRVMHPLTVACSGLEYLFQTWLLGGHDPDDGAVLVLGRHGDHDVDDADPRPRRDVLHHRRPHRGNPLAAFNNL